MQYVYTSPDGNTKTLSQKEAEALLVKSGCCGDAEEAQAALAKGKPITVPAKGADKGGTLAAGA